MPDANLLRDPLSQIVGEAGLLNDEQRHRYAVDGFNPQAVVRPSSIPEIQDVLAFAKDRHLSVIPAGSGTKLQIGNPPGKVDIVLSMTNFDNLVDYEPADLTVSVQAGIRLAALQEKLAQQGQYFPLDAPFAHQATIGGIVASNSSGPSRLRHGTARNSVLGMRVIQSSGNLVKSGGKVVKNVAGYDLNKLYIGSYGTLGIVTEVALKLHPLPETECYILATFQDIGHAAQVALEIANSQLLPTCINLSTPGVLSSDTSEPCLAIGLDGHPEMVSWQVNQVHSIAQKNATTGVEVLEGAEQQNLRMLIRAFPEGSWSPKVIVCKANLRLADVGTFIQTTLEAASRLHISVQVLGFMGNGVVYIALSEFSEDAGELQSIVETISKLRQHAVRFKGNLIIEVAPIELKQQIDVWGEVGSSLALMRQVKAKLDPIGLLNPGRFVGGI